MVQAHDESFLLKESIFSLSFFLSFFSIPTHRCSYTYKRLPDGTMARYKLHELHIMCEESVHLFALLVVVNVSKRTVFPENIETRSIHVQKVERRSVKTFSGQTSSQQF